MLALWTAKATGKPRVTWIDTTLWHTPKLIELGKATMRNNTDVEFIDMPVPKPPEEMTLNQAVYYLEYYRLVFRQMQRFALMVEPHQKVVQEGLQEAERDSKRYGQQVKAFLAMLDPSNDILYRGEHLHQCLFEHKKLVEAMKC